MFGIGITELAVIAVLAGSPLVLLYIALYMTRRMDGGANIASQTLIVEALERRMAAMEVRMTAMEKILLKRDSNV